MNKVSVPTEQDPLEEPVEDYLHNVLIGSALRRLRRGHMAGLADIELIQELAEKQVDNTSERRIRLGLRSYIACAGRRLRIPRPPAAPFSQNLSWFSEAVGLDATERAILQLVMTVERTSLESVLDVLGPLPQSHFIRLAATLVGLPEGDVERALEPESRLAQTGLVTLSREAGHFYPKIRLKEGITDLLLTAGLNRSALVARFLPETSAVDLAWSDFEHIEEHISLTRDMLSRALATRATGVNVLFYGTTGAGKTALASVIAREIGATLYNVVKPGDRDDSPQARGRLSSLVLGETLLRNDTSLLLFDELEDLFGWTFHLLGGRSSGTPLMSKQWFNQFLESNRIPTIWTSNRVDGIDPAFLRRFTYVIEFRPLGARQRARILMRHVGTDSTMTADDAHAIATRYPVSPAQVASAVRATRLLSSTGVVERAVLERILAPTEKLVGERDEIDASSFSENVYDVRAVNASSDLRRIADQLASWKPNGRAGLTLCLYGPPGTGKSEFVRYLAQRMGRQVLCRCVSDLLRPFVGETEQRIAAAFREAEEREAVLLFDEVDSFLRERKLAHRSWEVTQTNEFLQQLESQRGVAVCTTNLWHDIDAAALRRFIIKVEFRYLEREQVTALFDKMFSRYFTEPLQSRVVAHELGALANVAPGDLAAVARRLAAVGGTTHSPEEVLAMVVEEVRAKGAATSRIGFSAR